jgi:hypothetical protein
VVETPVVETPVVETPVVETPVVETEQTGQTYTSDELVYKKVRDNFSGFSDETAKEYTKLVMNTDKISGSSALSVCVENGALCRQRMLTSRMSRATTKKEIESVLKANGQSAQVDTWLRLWALTTLIPSTLKMTRSQAEAIMSIAECSKDQADYMEPVFAPKWGKKGRGELLVSDVLSGNWTQTDKIRDEVNKRKEKYLSGKERAEKKEDRKDREKMKLLKAFSALFNALDSTERAEEYEEWTMDKLDMEITLLSNVKNAAIKAAKEKAEAEAEAA